MDDNQLTEMLYANGIKFLRKGEILWNRFAFLYFDTFFIFTVYFISIQNT